VPHYDLASIKATFCTVERLRLTKMARECVDRLGLSLRRVVDVIQGMSRLQFYKSMTSNADPTVWQDVYHVPWQHVVLYVKFTTDASGYLVISFKER